MVLAIYCACQACIHTLAAHFFLAEEIFVATGIDIAGEVVAVGPGVENFKTGDKVVAVLSASVSAHSLLWCFFISFSL